MSSKPNTAENSHFMTGNWCGGVSTDLETTQDNLAKWRGLGERKDLSICCCFTCFHLYIHGSTNNKKMASTAKKMLK